MDNIYTAENKVLFFSDLHLGVHQNSQLWHKVALDLAEWIDSIMKKHKLNTIIFAGDVFHDRHEIGVNTLHVATQFFKILSNYTIYLIPGNHDSFLSSTVNVNSVEVLRSQNIIVYTTPTTIMINDRLVTFCPWKTDISTLTPVDMLVGHFEIQNFKMTAAKICDHGETTESLFAKSQVTITGHFHSRDHRVFDEGYILYLGSPYEMDFGDRGQQKGVSIIDFKNFSVNFIENLTCPKHYRLKIMDIVDKKYNNLPEIVKDNIVSIYVDTKVDTVVLDSLITKLTQYEPLQFRTEFDILDVAQIDSTEVKKLSLDIKTAFEEFVEHVETRATKRELLDKCLELYNICQTSHE